MAGGTELVSDLGEFGLIERFRARLPGAPKGEIWSGDDAAIVTGAPRAVLTTDVLVEGVDFDLMLGSAADVGWKAVAVSVSDVAAMGGDPTYCVAALSLPATTSVATVDDLLEGMSAAATRWGLAIVGGDLSQAPQLSLALTMLGGVEHPVLRSGAEVGDAICVTGTLGGAAGGLIALRRRLKGDQAEALVGRQVRPLARLEESRQLRSVATAMIDVSDGLLADLEHLLDASGRGCTVDLEAIPIDPNLAATDLGVDGLDLALIGGEDLELIVTMPPDALDPLAGIVTRIGTVTESGRTVGGRSLAEWTSKGWEHLRA